MQIDYALILSAGMGSRMGEIGKKLPKPLWPIFYKNLLELQFDYCRSLGVKKIYVNTHFLAEEIETFIKSDESFKDVIILHEDPLLDSGGAIHNLAVRKEVNYKGNLLLVNADQFLLFDQKYFKDALDALQSARAALFGITVDKSAKYNETVLKDGQLKEIKKSDGKKDYVTYSGLGVLKLDGLKPSPGITRFFETVANFKEEKVDFIVPKKFEYWDFGTAEIYFESIKTIYQNLEEEKKNRLIDFLRSNNALDGEVQNFFSRELNSISLDASNAFEKDSIVGKGIVQKVF